MSSSPSRPPGQHADWHAQISPALTTLIQNLFEGIARSVRADPSAVNRDRFLKVFHEVEALRNFTHFECVKPGALAKIKRIARSGLTGAFSMIEIGPWTAYCVIDPVDKSISWVTAIHKARFKGTSLRMFLEDSAERF
ncbi:MAG: hypothetical protein WCC21_17455 [Candidatus Acidiferrales bacterium]